MVRAGTATTFTGFYCIVRLPSQSVCEIRSQQWRSRDQSRPNQVLRWLIHHRGNVTLNPVSALTGATLDVILARPGVRDLCERIMEEVKCVGEAYRLQFRISVKERLKGAEEVPSIFLLLIFYSLVHLMFKCLGWSSFPSLTGSLLAN